MCRMMAVRTPDAAYRQRLLKDFRGLADRSYTGSAQLHSHRSGWGIVGRTDKGLAHLGRAPKDASRDPDFLTAVGNAGRVQPETVLLAHVRNASVGNAEMRNTHPFIRDGWAFCHNGTIHELKPPAGARAEGETDSEAYFLHLLGAIRRHPSVESAVRETIERIQASHRYTSATFLLTNGHDLYAYREVGTLTGSCGTRECALEHYVLGTVVSKEGVAVVQEPQAHAGMTGWDGLNNGELLVLRAGQGPKKIPLVKPVIA